MAAITTAFEDLQEQASAAQAALAAQAAAAVRAGVELESAVASGEPAALEREVDGVLALMRSTRLSLASRLAHSQATLDAAATAQRDAPEPPGAGGPRPALRELPAGAQQENVAANAARPAAAAQAGKRGAGGSPRDGARTRVAAIRASVGAWDVAGFLAQVGCPLGAGAVPATNHQEFEAQREAGAEALRRAAGTAGTAGERALAAESLAALQAWEWPVRRVQTPPARATWLSGLGL